MLRWRKKHPSPDLAADERSTPATRGAHRLRRRRRVALAALVLLVVFTATTARLFVWPSLPPLPAHADAIIELGGPGDRDAVTTELARQHRAPLVIQSTL